MIKSVFIFLVCTLISFSSISQGIKYDSILTKFEDFGKHLLYRNHDTAYIKSYAEILNVKLLGINKINFFQATGSQSDATVRYRPDRQINLGIGVAYKWFAIDLAFNVGIQEKSDIENSNFFDFQGTIFNSKQMISASLQYYYGYQLSDYSGFPIENGSNKNIAREDVRTTLISLQYLFAYNYDKFSIKAPFILNEVQRKSAGSLLLGGSFKSFVMDADSTLAPSQSVGLVEFPVTDVNNLRVGMNLGYMYSFVFLDGFFITLSFIPEIGVNIGDYQANYRTQFDRHISFGYKTMSALGYNSERFYTGLQVIGESFNINLDDQYKMWVGNGKAKFFIGYRFGNGKKQG